MLEMQWGRAGLFFLSAFALLYYVSRSYRISDSRTSEANRVFQGFITAAMALLVIAILLLLHSFR